MDLGRGRDPERGLHALRRLFRAAVAGRIGIVSAAEIAAR
jgi:hypothetical protein